MGLIAHYKLDGLAASIGQDLTYFNNSGKLVPADGKFGTAYQRMGLNDGADYFGTTEDIHLSSSFTMSCWAYVTSAETSANGLVTNHDHITNTGAGINVKYISPTDFRISCNTGTGTSRTYDSYYGTSNIKDRWSHLLLRFDASTNNLSLWVDGVEEFSMTYAMKCVPNKLQLFKWSTSFDSRDYRPGAIIDDVRIYDHALSEREVRDLSQGLVLHYTFDQFQEPTENLLRKSGATPLISAVDILGRSTKTINTDGSVRFVNNGTGESVVRLYCDLADLSSGETYGVQVKFRENTGTVSLDWCDTSIINGVATSTQSSGLLYGIGTRATYDGTYRFLDINISSGGSVTLYEDQVEKKKYTTPFVNGTRAGIVRDQSTQGNDAPLALANTPKWVEGGMVGKGCYEFAGNGKHIDTGNKFNFKKTDSFTVGFWINPEDHSSGAAAAGGVIGKGHWFDNTWDVFIYNANFLRFECSGNATRNGITGVNSPILPLHQWSHFVVTYDSGSITGYLNGQVIGTTTYFGTGDFSNNNNVMIGMRPGDVSRTLKGQIDDVRIYTTALSDDEVKELYQQRASLDSHGNFYSSLISSSVGYQKVWGDGTGVGFTTYGIDVSSVSTNGVLRFTTSILDPMIHMYNIGSFDPNVYKFIQVKYRVVSGNAGNVEIFFTNTQYTSAHGAQHRDAPLNSDGNWNVVTVAMHTHPNWTNSNITGWRFDMGTASGVTIEVEWIRLVSDTGALSVKSNKVVGDFSEIGITNGLVAYYPLNKDAKDYSGNGYHGTVTGAVLTGGGFDGKGAYSFDGVDDKITSTQTVPFNLTVFTVSFWISTTTTNNTVVMERGANNGWSIQTMPSNLGVGKIGMVSGGASSVARSLNTINDGAWHYVAIVNNNAVATVYVDGEDVTLGNVTGAPSYNSVPFIIGQRETDIAVFNGGISNVKIFNRALTPEEIAVEYKRTGVSKMTQHNGTVYIQGQVKETI